MATKVSEGLDKNKIKDDFGKDAGVKVIEINDIRKNDAHIDLTIDGWLSNDACKQSGPAQPASFPVRPADATRGTQRARDGRPYPPGSDHPGGRLVVVLEAVKVVVAAAVMVAVAAVAAVVLTSTAVAEGTVASVIATGLLTGCISGATVDLALTRLFTPEAVTTVKERIAVATAGCLAGAGMGALLVPGARNAAIGMRRHLSSDEAIVGQSGLAAAKSAGVTMDNRLASMVDGVADGALRASQ